MAQLQDLSPLIMAILDLPTPAGAAPQPVVSAWLDLFIAQHADAEVYGGLFSSCRAGRAWALSTAPALTVRLRAPCTKAGVKPWQRQLASLRQRLQTRGGLPASLVVACTDGRGSAGAVRAVPDTLGDMCAGIRALRLELEPDERDSDSHALTAALHYTASAFSSLRALDVHTACTKPRFSWTACRVTLPPPASVPHLASLSMTVRGGDDGLCRSASLLLPQLTSFTVRLDDKHMPATSALWDVLFTPTSTTHTLTHFTTRAILDQPLLRALLRHVPNLTHLTVHSMAVTLTDESEKEWSVGVIQCVSERCDLARLAKLPRSRAGRVEVVGQKGVAALLTVVSAEGLDPSVACRLHEWRVMSDVIEMVPSHTLSSEDAMGAASMGLRQLGALQEYSGTIMLRGWHWPIPYLTSLSDPLSSLTHLTLGLHMDSDLTDDLLTALLALPVNVRSLTVQGLSLTRGAVQETGTAQHTATSGQPATARSPAAPRATGTEGHTAAAQPTSAAGSADSLTAQGLSLGSGAAARADSSGPGAAAPHTDASRWPWSELSVACLSVESLVRLPNPACGACAGVPRVVCVGVLDLSGVTKATATQLKDWLQHIRFKPLTHTPHTLTFTLKLHVTPAPHNDTNHPTQDVETDDNRLLTFNMSRPKRPEHTAKRQEAHTLTQLSVASALRFTDANALKALSVCMCGVAITKQVMESLRGLPAGAGCLDMRGCTWPLPHTEYKALASHVPTSYTEWRLDCVTPEWLRCVWGGVSERRAGVSPLLRIVVKGLSETSRGRPAGKHFVLVKDAGP